MWKMTMAAAAGALLVQTTEMLRERAAPEGGLTLEQREILSHLKMAYTLDAVGERVPTILFKGVNVQIVNGVGTMQSTNGRGNLIVGYQVENPLIQRTGSHNLIVGEDHTYASYGGIASGEANQLLGPNSTALGGFVNVVRGERCAVVGGTQNEVDGIDNTIIAGDQSFIGSSASRSAIISSWESRVEDNDFNVIIGGQNNQITGGSFNAVVTGSGHSLQFADYVGVVSGEGHTPLGAAFAALVGGERNHIANNTYYSVIVGGSENSVTEMRGTVVGGLGNHAQGESSTVGGGLNRTAAGEFDWVAGGLFQDQ